LKTYSYSIYEALGALGIQALSVSGQHSNTEIYKVKQNKQRKPQQQQKKTPKTWAL